MFHPKVLHIEYSFIEKLEGLTDEHRKLVLKAKDALENSYAPYSQFRVGAAVLMENGSMVVGSNQENASFPAGICAERLAIFSASQLFPNQKIKAMAVIAKASSVGLEIPITPCGICRQVMSETEQKQGSLVELILASDGKGVYCFNSFSALLPLHFQLPDTNK